MVKKIKFKRSSVFITKKQISDKISKTKVELKGLERLQKLEKKFQLGVPSSKNRRKILASALRSKDVNPEAIKKLKVFKIMNPKKPGKSLFIPGVPKGIPIRRKK